MSEHLQALVDEILRHTGPAGIFRAKARTQAMRVHEMAVGAKRELVEAQEAKTKIRGGQNLSAPDGREKGPSVDANVSRSRSGT